MNYVIHLNSFFRLVRQDERLKPSHISLYMALFQRWNEVHFSSAFTIHREQIMQLCKIGSKNTYHACMKELHLARYIVYQPPLHKFAKAKVKILSLPSGAATVPQAELFPPPGNGTDNGPVLTHTGTGNDTAPVPETGRIYKQINKLINSVNSHSTLSGTKNIFQQTIPSGAETAAYCRQKGYDPAEGKKFFLHYESTGWLTGRQTPITNWQAAADKWMLNINPKKTPSVYGNSKTHLHSQDDKNYAEPF
ncbi:hypothetical protein [Chitinophaga sp. XS-30]|uniref:hypothetical protein n=1 Tax=Chitinophaga sp. XS-30 TaxID=2604421 RepID=UPI0011DDB2A5|nr:hypothetical protein [Chitinophaga sp. XS-30]QEH43300.1 hypothetical protein FW415_21520 [Chitinophaga sp. XS-30]